MKSLMKTTLFTLVLSLSPLNAGGDHSHAHGHGHSHTIATQAKVQTIAKLNIKELVSDKIIDSSWLNIAILDIKKKKFGHDDEWMVRFNNTKIKDVKKQMLYVFINLYGEITGTNYSGL